MRVIKFPLQLGWNTLLVEHYCEPIALEYQDAKFCVWCKEFTSTAGVLPNNPLQLLLVTTSEPVDPQLTYIDTTSERNFVAHLFQQYHA